MRLLLASTHFLLLSGVATTSLTVVASFQLEQQHSRPSRQKQFATTPLVADPVTAVTQTKTLGLLTFDLDDTLYPIAPVIDEANAGFARAMNTFGFDGIQPKDIVETSKKIREEMSEKDPAGAAVLTHTEIRMLAIRREMENFIFKKKLQATADDWATAVPSLSAVVVSHAKKYGPVFFFSRSIVCAIDRLVIAALNYFLSFIDKRNKDGPPRPYPLPWYRLS
jgi:hypothetical protein